MDNLKLNINCSIVLRDSNGKIKSTREIHNTTTTAGKNGLADQLLASPSLGKPTHMARHN
jgi:hypothetical protein